VAITFIEWNTAVAGSTSLVATYPVTVNLNDLLVAVTVIKPFSAGVPGQPTNADFDDGSNPFINSGSIAPSDGAGSTRSVGWWRIADGTEGGTTTTWTSTGGNTGIVRMARFRIPSTSTWDVDSMSIADNSETGTSVSTNTFSGSMAGEAGDVIVIGVGFQDDAALTHSSQAFSAPSVTVSAVTFEAKNNTATGTDCGCQYGICTVTAGSDASVSPAYTATASVSGKSATSIGLVRIREIANPNPKRRMRAVDQPTRQTTWGTYT
jgi:hypothetical protein